MKKVILLTLVAICFLVSFAQYHQGFRLGIRVNAGLSDVKVYDGYKMSFGCGLGWISEYNFTSKLYLQSGIGFENVANEKCDDAQNAFY